MALRVIRYTHDVTRPAYLSVARRRWTRRKTSCNTSSTSAWFSTCRPMNDRKRRWNSCQNWSASLVINHLRCHQYTSTLGVTGSSTRHSRKSRSTSCLSAVRSTTLADPAGSTLTLWPRPALPGVWYVHSCPILLSDSHGQPLIGRLLQETSDTRKGRKLRD